MPHLRDLIYTPASAFRSGPMPPHPVSEADWLRAAEALGQGEAVLGLGFMMTGENSHALT